MRKLIHSKFELDLSHFKISDTEENNWFSDSFFTKYSFPFDIDLTDDLDVALDFISLYNTSPETYFEVKYVHNDKIEDAIFEIESHQVKLSGVIRFGFEQLPSFDKNLSELSLDKFDLAGGTTIYNYAETIIPQKWPAVNFNFPQVHVDKYDVTDDVWLDFGGIVNNRKTGAFLINTVEGGGSIVHNLNVMQPMPYCLHILQRIMIDSGYTLAGEILNDERLKKACLFADTDYFYKNALSEYSALKRNDEHISSQFISGQWYRCTYQVIQVIEGIGNYRINGTFRMLSVLYEQAFCVVKLNGTNVFEAHREPNEESGEGTVFVNINVITTVATNTLEFYVLTKADPTDEMHFPINFIVAPQTVAVANIINENKIDLTKSVPNITVQDFIKAIKNWFNYDLTIVGNSAIMNPVETQINYDDTEDFQFSEIKNPVRKFKKGNSFLLKFQDIENKSFPFLPVFHSTTGVVNTGFVADEKTTTIEINALPLPLLTKTEVHTAYAVESNDSKVFLVKYDGLYRGNNYSQSNEEYLLPAVHLKSWKKWFDFRINSHGFNWSFPAWNEQLINLKAKTKIFAYKKVHIIKNINKTEIKPDYYEVDIETESLE